MPRPKFPLPSDQRWRVKGMRRLNFGGDVQDVLPRHNVERRAVRFGTHRECQQRRDSIGKVETARESMRGHFSAPRDTWKEKGRVRNR